MSNGNTLSVWIMKGLYIPMYHISVCVYIYVLYTWISFGLLKVLVVLRFALSTSNFRIKVPTDCAVIGL